MYLTLYDLDNLRKSCDNISNLVKEIRKSYSTESDERKLFVSRNDYEESLKIKNQSPQDFYFIRLFDIFIQVVYNRNLKKYLIYCENFYSDILAKYERYPNSDKSYIISSCFEEALEVFRDLVIDLVSNKILSNGLF